jgi:signal transduction histidine kinase
VRGPCSRHSSGQEAPASSDEQARLIEALLTLASSESGLNRHEPVNLAAVTATLAGLQPETGRLGTHLDEVTVLAPLDGNSLLIEQLVASLLTIAVRHNVAGRRVEVRLAQPLSGKEFPQRPDIASSNC